MAVNALWLTSQTRAQRRAVVRRRPMGLHATPVHDRPSHPLERRDRHLIRACPRNRSTTGAPGLCTASERLRGAELRRGDHSCLCLICVPWPLDRIPGRADRCRKREGGPICRELVPAHRRPHPERAPSDSVKRLRRRRIHAWRDPTRRGRRARPAAGRGGKDRLERESEPGAACHCRGLVRAGWGDVTGRTSACRRHLLDRPAS